MSNIDRRQVDRESLFLLAHVRVDGQQGASHVKVRNLSAGGMMAEGEAKVGRGTQVAVELRNIGWIDGSVAWKQDNRFGIAFVAEIDPSVVRAPTPGVETTNFEIPHYTRNYQTSPSPSDPGRLRKI